MDGCKEKSDWRCGDKCLSISGVCDCMQDTTNFEIRYDEAKWCCKSTSDECEVVKRDNKGHAIIVKCIGASLPLTKQCQNDQTNTPTCNFYPPDKHRNFRASRSYMDICNDGSSCVDETQLCQFRQLCENKEDLKWCMVKDTNWILPDNWKPLHGHENDFNCLLGGKLSEVGPQGQWIDEAGVNDGVYHCLNRRDEDPYAKKWKIKPGPKAEETITSDDFYFYFVIICITCVTVIVTAIFF